MLRTFWNSEYEADKYLAQAIINGIKKHPDLQCKEAYDEINACLEDTWISSNVNNARWSAYYLNLQNIIDVCWEAGSIVGPGRGSGVGFILLYCLDITQINPLKGLIAPLLIVTMPICNPVKCGVTFSKIAVPIKSTSLSAK